MKATPMILGATALALVSGAVAGQSIGTEPLGLYQDVTDTLPQQRVNSRSAALQIAERLPNHYPLETPEGTIEVEDLAWHGRYRDRVPAYAPLPDDDYSYSYAEYKPNRDRFDREERSREAELLDAQQPDPRAGRTMAHVEVTGSAYGRTVYPASDNRVRAVASEASAAPAPISGDEPLTIEPVAATQVEVAPDQGPEAGSSARYAVVAITD